MSVREANIALLQERWPELADELAEVAPSQEAELVSGVPHPTLRIDGVQLCGAVDPEAEARLQAASVPVDATDVRVYDPAQGALPRALLLRERVQRLEVILLAPAAFLTSFEIVDHTTWMRDARVELRRARPDERPRAPYAYSPGPLHIAEPSAWLLRDALLLVGAASMQAQQIAAREAEFSKRLVENADVLRASEDMQKLVGTGKGRRAVVAASGPSLSDELAWLTRCREDVTLIAVNSALRPLLEDRLVPDFVIAVDEQPTLAAHLRIASEWTEACEHVPLVHVVTLAREAIVAWQGPRYAARLDLPRFQSLAKPVGKLWCSGTVTHSACDLARQIGASDLVLLGADFGYPNSRSHASGAPDAAGVNADARRLRVADGLGTDIATDVNLMGYLRDLDDWLGAHPEFRAQKRGRSGAAMRNAPWMNDG